MEAHELDIAITPEGKVAIHIKGVKGAACDAYTKLFEEILYGDADVERTAEFYEPETGVDIHLEQRE